jgi:excisionase family DNA binding protein
MDTTEDRLLKPAEVAEIFRVDPKTVSRWAEDGRIARVKTPGGHNRFRESDVRGLLQVNGISNADALIAAVLAKRDQAAPSRT